MELAPPLAFDPSCLRSVPTQFMCTEADKPCVETEELHIPTINLHGFFTGDSNGTTVASKFVLEASENYGVFQVVNHGVDARILE